MKDHSNITLDDLLDNFIYSPDTESDRALVELYQKGIDPAVTGILRYKLRISLRGDDDGYVNQIGMDLLSDVRAALLPVLQRMRSRTKTERVENFSAYIKAAALNAYRQYLRDKYPNRLRLRNKVHYILTRRTGYALWKDDAGAWLCGLTDWREKGTLPASIGSIEGLDKDLSPVTSGSLDDNAKIISLIGSLFERSAAPMVFEDVVSIIWDTLGLREPQNITEDEGAWNSVASKGRSIEDQLDDRQRLERLWKSIYTLPLRHRRALLLNLTDAKGDNLIALLPRLGIASIRRIAEALEYEPEDFAKLWNDLPLDDLSIAERMGLTRQQVINLRQSARASLRRRTLESKFE